MIDSIKQFNVEFSPTHEIPNLISEIDEFKGKWTALQNLPLINCSRCGG